MKYVMSQVTKFKSVPLQARGAQRGFQEVEVPGLRDNDPRWW